MLSCPECGCTDSVRCFRTSTEESGEQINRRRRCTKCGVVFGTQEKVVKSSVKRRKSSEQKELEKQFAKKVAKISANANTST